MFNKFQSLLLSLEGKKKRGRPILDWMMKEDHSKLKERAGHCGERRHWMYELT